MTADKDASARAVSDVECAVVAELVVRIRDAQLVRARCRVAERR